MLDSRNSHGNSGIYIFLKLPQTITWGLHGTFLECVQNNYWKHSVGLPWNLSVSELNTAAKRGKHVPEPHENLIFKIFEKAKAFECKPEKQPDISVVLSRNKQTPYALENDGQKSNFQISFSNNFLHGKRSTTK
ncbi:hypothetical protein BU17DRAFT_60228 [Hysterangium stoloniferum]|nr:hypothetical protein BU17DRAFT_60228 [Hysterangium stoloniferum]